MRRGVIGLRARRLTTCTWFALSVFLWSVALPVFERHDVVDPDEGAFQFLGSSGGTLRIEKPSTDRDVPAHCIFCHWQRAVSGAMVADAAGIATPATALLPLHLADARLAAVASAPHSSRGPPLQTSL
jgi:hypothetical protein